MARRVVEIKGLDEMARRFDRLGRHAFADAVQEALDGVAAIAVWRLEHTFETRIEGGPVDFTKIRRGNRNSSVVSTSRNGANKGKAESALFVQKKQSAYLKYLLGEDTDGKRESGDVGAATEHNFIPVPGLLKKYQGISVTREGNLPKNALRTLIRRAQSQRVRDAKRMGRKNAELTHEEYDALRIKRRKRLGLGRKDAFAEGRKRRGKKDFAPRASPAEQHLLGAAQGQGWAAVRRSRLLAASARSRMEARAARRGGAEVRLQDDKLIAGWNVAVGDAACDIPEIFQRSLARTLTRKIAARRAKMDRKNAGERAKRSAARA